MSNSISLHPEHGVNPTIEQNQCPVCGHIFETGDLLLLGRNRGKEAKMHTVTGVSMCPEDQEKYDNGFIAVIEVKNPEDAIVGGTIRPEDMDRTGRIIHIKKEFFQYLFETEENPPMVCMPKKAVDRVVEIYEDSIKEQEEEDSNEE